jgi:hypothetical protein
MPPRLPRIFSPNGRHADAFVYSGRPISLDRPACIPEIVAEALRPAGRNLRLNLQRDMLSFDPQILLHSLATGTALVVVAASLRIGSDARLTRGNRSQATELRHAPVNYFYTFGL